MKRKISKRLRVECLENRNLMAGNVTASITNGNLYIDGDGAANTITVESAGVNTVQVRGFNDGSASATSINGNANALQIFSGFTGSVFIHMNGGSDLVRVTNLALSGSLTVDLGAGADEAVLGRDTAAGDARFAGTPSGPLYVSGGVSVLGGTEQDLVVQSDLHVHGAASVDLGAGDDTLRIQRPTGSGANVEYAGSFSILPGDGNDAVDVTGLIVNGNLTVDDATGQTTLAMTSMDIYGDFAVSTDQLNDQVTISATNARKTLQIVTEGGADTVNVSAIANLLLMDTGSANDDVHVSSSNTKELNVQLGTGDDNLDVLSDYTDVLKVFGNTGNDALLVRNTRALDAYFFGDGGTDTYRDSTVLPNNIRSLYKYSVERNERI